jgi:hypothetical protein
LELKSRSSKKPPRSMGFLLSLFSNHEDGRNTFLQNTRGSLMMHNGTSNKDVKKGGSILLLKMFPNKRKFNKKLNTRKKKNMLFNQ